MVHIIARYLSIDRRGDILALPYHDYEGQDQLVRPGEDSAGRKSFTSGLPNPCADDSRNRVAYCLKVWCNILLG